MRYVISYDLGTSSLKASIIDDKLNVVAEAVQSYKTYSDSGVIREQNPVDWERSMEITTKELMNKFPNPDLIEGIGISGHSLGVVAVDKNKELLINRTPIWSDGRAQKQADEFFSTVDYEEWYNRTGNGFTRQLYSLFKIMWYKENMPRIYENASFFLGTKDWLNMRLCGNVYTDHSYASGSGVYDLAKHSYHDEYIEKADLRKDIFPPIKESSAVIGTLTKEASLKLGLPQSVKVVCGGVDNACMTLGAGCIRDGESYVSLGSSAWIAASASSPVTNFEKKIYTWAHCIPDMYIPSSGIFSAGTSHEWVISNLFSELDDNEKYSKFDEMAKNAPLGSENVFFCPVMSGGSNVDASTQMKGGFINIDLNTTKECLARATYEGIAYELKLSFDAISSVMPIEKDILFVGGGAKSRVWCRIFADILEKNILKSDVSRAIASIGAASLALVGIGAWENFEGLQNIKISEKIECNEKNIKPYQKGFKIFNKVCRAHADVFKAIEEEIQ